MANKSPLPQEVEQVQTTEEKKLINFYDALKELANGKKITKVEWNNEKVYGVLKDALVMLYKEDDKFYNWIISDGDLDGIDWYVIE